MSWRGGVSRRVPWGRGVGRRVPWGRGVSRRVPWGRLRLLLGAPASITSLLLWFLVSLVVAKATGGTGRLRTVNPKTLNPKP